MRLGSFVLDGWRRPRDGVGDAVKFGLNARRCSCSLRKERNRQAAQAFRRERRLRQHPGATGARSDRTACVWTNRIFLLRSSVRIADRLKGISVDRRKPLFDEIRGLGPIRYNAPISSSFASDTNWKVFFQRSLLSIGDDMGYCRLG
jgi:hypothetical protein